mgnify:CR=1 FL=1
MTNEESHLIKLLETRIRQLVMQDEELSRQNAQLWEQLSENDALIESLRAENQKLSAQYADLKTARMLQLGDNDTRNAKLRISRLMREVDKCIALLKAER